MTWLVSLIHIRWIVIYPVGSAKRGLAPIHWFTTTFFFCFPSSFSSFYWIKIKSRDVNGANLSPLKLMRFLRILFVRSSWKATTSSTIMNFYPPPPQVSFLPSEKDISLTTKLLVRALKRKLLWVSSHDLRWSNKTNKQIMSIFI